MNIKLLSRFVICVFLLSLPVFTHAQWQGIVRSALDNEDDGEKWSSVTRMELLISYPVSTAFIETQYEMYDASSDKITRSKKALHQLSNSKSWGAGISMSFPLTAGKKTCLAISSSIMGNMMSFEVKKPIQVTQSQYINKDFTYTCVSLPVSLDFKYGADAVYNRGIKGMFGLGFGAYPYVCAPGLGGEGLPGLKPFVKVEAGFFAGVAMKLKFICVLSSLQYDSRTVSEPNYNMGELYGDYSVVGSPDMTLALAIMPFSRKWRDEKPWR